MSLAKLFYYRNTRLLTARLHFHYLSSSHYIILIYWTKKRNKKDSRADLLFMIRDISRMMCNGRYDSLHSSQSATILSRVSKVCLISGRFQISTQIKHIGLNKHISLCAAARNIRVPARLLPPRLNVLTCLVWRK